MEHQSPQTTENPKPRSLAKIYHHDSWQSAKGFGACRGLTNAKSGKRWTDAIEGNAKPDKFRAPTPLESLYKELKITCSQINECNIYRLEPKENKSSIVILYLHGGAYVNNSSKFHWETVHQIIKDSNCTVIYPDYPLAPKASHVEGFQFLDALYQQILSEFDPKDLVFMGDSAGAGFALAFSQKLNPLSQEFFSFCSQAQGVKKEGKKQPSQLILLSPWLDVSGINPEMVEVDKYDPMLPIEGLKMCGELWAKGTDVKNYLVSPLYGDFEELPLISLFISTHDVLEPDCRKFRDICDEKGVAINYYNYPKMIHDWVIMGMSESQKALEQIKELLTVVKD